MRGKGIEPLTERWQRSVLPLNEPRITGVWGRIRTDGFTVLQTVALGLSATHTLFGTRYENRTRLSALKGQRPYR